MEILTGTLLSIWISLCMMVATIISVFGLAGLIRAVVSSNVRAYKLEAFSNFVFYTLLAGLFYTHVWYLLANPQKSSEPPATRDIHMTVPKDSSVNIQITSGNNTVNVTNL